MSQTKDKYLDIFIKYAHSFTALLTPKGEIIALGKRLIEDYEVALSEFQGKSYRLFLDHPDEIQLFDQALSAINKLGKVTQFESQRHKDGGFQTLLTMLCPAKNSIGELDLIIVEERDISEQRSYEQQLVAEKAFTTAILDNTDAGISVFDPKGKILYRNTVSKQLLYVSVPSGLTNTIIYDLYDTYNTKSNEIVNDAPLKFALEGIEVKNYEIVANLKENLPQEFEYHRNTYAQQRFFSFSTRLIKNKQGQTTAIVISHFEITELKNAQKLQAELQERFSHAFENAFIGILVLSPRAVILDSNRAMSTILDIDNHELKGKALSEITHRDDLNLTEELFTSLESGLNNTIFYEKKLLHSNGSFVDVIIGVSVSRDADEQITYVIAHVLDVTENNNISKALATSQEQYQSIFNSQLDAVIVTNLSGKILNINPAAISLFKYSIEEVDGVMLWELFSVIEDPFTVFNALFSNGDEKISIDTIHYQRKSGEVFPADTVGYTVFDGDSQKIGYTWIIQDTSDKRIAEVTLARINQRMAVSREEERRRLARELHDGIVQDLMGFSYELANFEKESSIEDKVILPLSELRRMRASLTHSIKQLRSFISDLRPVGLEEFGFQSALESYIALIERDRYSNVAFPNIVMKIEAPETLPMPITLCLFRSAQEALANILKHANAKQVSILLYVKESSNNHVVILTIEDNGNGFQVPENLDDLSNEQHYGIIGINERVTILDGEFLIESQVEIGTKLTLTLPIGENL